MAYAMDPEERQRFLTDLPARTGALATISPDGSPHVAPIWFDLDDDDTIVFTTGADTVKGRNLRHDPRVALTVDDEKPPFSFVVIRGEASIVDDPDLLLSWATRLGGRYMGEDRAEEYGRRNAVPTERLIRVRPTNIVAQADIAD